MFNKKVLALTVITLTGALALTGCTSSNSTVPDNSSGKDVTNITAEEGTQSLETLSSVYSASLAKAESEGIIEKTAYVSSNSVTIYDPAISKTIAVIYESNPADGSPTDSSLLAMKGNLASFAKISYDDKLMQVSNDSKGTFIITAKDSAADKTKVTINTKDGLITSYEIIDFNGSKVLSTTFQYGGLTAEDKAALTKYANTQLPSTNSDTGTVSEAPILIEE